jgi:hypothetical protein
MCNSVLYCEREYNTPSELAVLVGGAEKLVWQDRNRFMGWPADKDRHVMDQCLCQIDLAATLGNAGFKWTRGIDPMEWFVAEPSAN